MLILALAITPYFLSYGRILNFPNYLYWIILPFGIVASLFFARDRKLSLWTLFWRKPTWRGFFETLLVTVVFSCGMTLSFLSAFNFYIIYHAERSITIEKAQLKGVVYGWRWSSKAVHFELNDNLQSIYHTYDPLMPKLHRKNALWKDYVVCLYLRKAPFDMYVLEKWHIEHK